jgi:outer membrane receptor protein involved in Fe transport
MKRFGGQFRHGLAAALLASTAVLGASPARAQQLSIDIPAQSAAEAITNLGQQTGTQILFDHALLSRIRSNPVHGTMSVRDALAAMLKGSNFEVATSASGALIVRPRGEPGNAPASAATDPQSTSSLGKEGDVATKAGEITVTGTRIRGTSSASPLVTVSRSEIERSGYSSINEVLRAIPQNAPGALSATTVGANGPSVISNVSAASGVSLRGLGADATLILVDGRRLAHNGFTTATDASAVPLGAVERIEILTDGASSIYGADAVGGVVNFKLRNSYQGLQTHFGSSFPTQGGGEEQTAGALAGLNWEGGNLLVNYDYGNQHKLEAAQRAVSRRTADPSTDLIGAIETHQLFAKAHQRISDALEVFAQGLYSHRNWDNDLVSFGTNYQQNNATQAYQASVGVRFTPVARWSGEAVASLASDVTKQRQTSISVASGAAVGQSSVDYRNKDRAIEFSLEGPVSGVLASDIRVALGGGVRRESGAQFVILNPIAASTGARTNYFLFGEASIPLIANSNGSSASGSILELSLSGRYDRYSDVGKAYNPKVGVIVRPTPDLTFKGSWGTSFRAPPLIATNTPSQVIILDLGGIITATSLGSVSNARPEKSNAWSVTTEYTPHFASGLKISATYFDYDFKDKFLRPIPGAFASAFTENELAPFLTLNPTPDQVNSLVNSAAIFHNYSGLPFSASIVKAIINNDYRNIARWTAKGFDFSLDYRAVGPNGALGARIDGTHLKQDQQFVAGASPTNVAGTVFGPPAWRVRGTLYAEHDMLSGALSGNYIGSEIDTAQLSRPRIPAFFTVDAQIAAKFRLSGHSSLRLALSAVNLLDKNPPAISASAGNYSLGFDSANHSPLGRQIKINATAEW